MSDEIPVKDADLDELKREMRSAQWMDWVEANKNALIGAVAVVLIVLIATGLWLENDRAQRATAATVYQQAVSEISPSKKQSLLESVSRDFADSTYSALALMQLAALDRANAEAHLNALIAHDKAMEEWVWQARIDLAEIKMAAGDQVAAKALLEQSVGEQYQQLRLYLLAQISADESEKQQYLQRALDAPSTDPELKQKIEMQMSKKVS